MNQRGRAVLTEQAGEGSLPYLTGAVTASGACGGFVAFRTILTAFAPAAGFGSSEASTNVQGVAAETIPVTASVRRAWTRPDVPTWPHSSESWSSGTVDPATNMPKRSPSRSRNHGVVIADDESSKR